MEKFEQITSIAIPLDLANVDTDMIIPAQYLTNINRTGFGKYLFQRLREHSADFVLNQAGYQGAAILLTRANFGCGSSREHAVWALMQAGIKVIIAESFSDIFKNNADKNGLLAVSLPEETISCLLNQSKAEPLTLTVDLKNQTVSTSQANKYCFEFDPFRKTCFLNGQDDLDYLLEATR